MSIGSDGASSTSLDADRADTGGVMRLLRSHREFRRMFLAHSVSRAGDAFNTVALVVLVFDLTGSGVGVAGVVVFEVLAVLLLGPVAGLAADRLSRRRLMVGADLTRAAFAAALVFSTDSVGLAYAVAFGLAAGAVVFNPAASSLLPEIVGEHDVVTANSALWSAAVIGQIALAPTAGIVIARFGVGAAFAVNAATFVVSALVVAGLRSGRTPAEVVVTRWADVFGGVRAVRSNPLLIRLAIVQVLASMSAGATGGLLVVLAERRMGVGPSGFGALLAAIGIGAAAGPLLLRRFVRPGDRRWLFGPFAVRGGVDLTLATVSSPVVAGPALVVYGMSTSTGMVAYQSTLQTLVPPAARGRAFAFYDVLWNISRLLSLAAGGIVAELFDVRVVYIIGGLLLLAAAAVGLTARLEPVIDRSANRRGSSRGAMEIELLYVRDCPSADAARGNLVAALARLDSDSAVHNREVSSADEAIAFGMNGSPTILIHGRDPFASEHDRPSLSCRLYPTAVGVAQTPSVEQLVDAIARLLDT